MLLCSHLLPGRRAHLRSTSSCIVEGPRRILQGSIAELTAADESQDPPARRNRRTRQPLLADSPRGSLRHGRGCHRRERRRASSPLPQRADDADAICRVAARRTGIHLRLDRPRPRSTARAGLPQRRRRHRKEDGVRERMKADHPHRGLPPLRRRAQRAAPCRARHARVVRHPRRLPARSSRRSCCSSSRPSSTIVTCFLVQLTFEAEAGTGTIIRHGRHWSLRPRPGEAMRALLLELQLGQGRRTDPAAPRSDHEHAVPRGTERWAGTAPGSSPRTASGSEANLLYFARPLSRCTYFRGQARCTVLFWGASAAVGLPVTDRLLAWPAWLVARTGPSSPSAGDAILKLEFAYAVHLGRRPRAPRARHLLPRRTGATAPSPGSSWLLLPHDGRRRRRHVAELIERRRAGACISLPRQLRAQSLNRCLLGLDRPRDRLAPRVVPLGPRAARPRRAHLRPSPRQTRKLEVGTVSTPETGSGSAVVTRRGTSAAGTARSSGSVTCRWSSSRVSRASSAPMVPASRPS